MANFAEVINERHTPTTLPHSAAHSCLPAHPSSRAAGHIPTTQQTPLADNRPVTMNVGPYPSGIREFCGCPGTLPAVAPGEVRVMGVTVHPSIAAGAHGIFQNAMVPDRIADSFDAEGDPDDQIDAPAATVAAITALSQTKTKRNQKTIKVQIAQLCGLTEDGCLLKPLPERIPAQKLLATEDLKLGDVVCPVGGYLSWERAHREELVRCGQRACGALHMPNRVFDLMTGMWHFSLPNLQFPGTTPESHPGLCLNALGYGNEAALVNDPAENPLAQFGQAGVHHPLWQGCESQAPSQQAAAPGAENSTLRIKANCEIFIFTVREIPIPWLIVTAPIRKGEQLLRSYSPGFWAEFAALWDMAEGFVDDPAAAAAAARSGPPPPGAQHRSQGSTHGPLSWHGGAAAGFHESAEPKRSVVEYSPQVTAQQDRAGSSSGSRGNGGSSVYHQQQQQGQQQQQQQQGQQQMEIDGSQDPSDVEGARKRFRSGEFQGAGAMMLQQQQQQQQQWEQQQQQQQQQQANAGACGRGLVDRTPSSNGGEWGQAHHSADVSAATTWADDPKGLKLSAQELAAGWEQHRPGCSSPTPSIQGSSFLTREQHERVKREFVAFHNAHAPDANGDYLLEALVSSLTVSCFPTASQAVQVKIEGALLPDSIDRIPGLIFADQCGARAPPLSQWPPVM
ncbi:MAG: hypothetical protein WDW36_002490 [Sanguina aurantia]